MNALVANTHGLYDTDMYNMGLDFSYSSVPSVSPEHLQLFFNGTVFEYPNEVVPKHGFANMHVDGSTKEAIQAGLSSQMIDSFLFFVHNKGYFDKTITQESIPASVPLNLTSDHFDKYFPGFLKRYGPNEPVSIRLNTYVAPEALIKDS